VKDCVKGFLELLELLAVHKNKKKIGYNTSKSFIT